MIEHGSGNLLTADVDALVNTVNTVGIMGKGIALQFRQAFPDNYKAYKVACDRDEVRLGSVFVFERLHLQQPHFILNFPTKKHWRSKSRLADIESGLADLVSVIRANKIGSIAIPPLGCGNGGLEWSDVRPMIVEAVSQLADVRVVLYGPHATPQASQMPVGTEKPKITPTRAAMLALMRVYAEPGYRVSMLEMQKLAYFLQVAGEPMRLEFDKGDYGPYAEVLHHVLQRLEGHYIRGYGDRSAGSTMWLLPEAAEVADQALEEATPVARRYHQVRDLIEGFETPYGLELLATVHYLATQADEVATDAAKAVELVHEWSDRKRQRFRPAHVQLAWRHLAKTGWIDSESI